MSKKKPLVSVIVTTFNRCEMLAETIQSILDQTFLDFELIVVDNMSEDGTQKYICSIQDHRIRYYRNSNFGVIATNRNFGIRKARGIYIAFCDDDDLWIQNKLDIQMSLLELEDSAAMCYTQAESFIDGVVVKKAMNRRVICMPQFIGLLQGNFIPNSSVLIKKSVFDELGLLNESAELREDYEMWLRVSKNYKIVSTQQSLVRYRLHRSNIAGSKIAETKRAIRTLQSLVRSLDIPFYLYFPNLLVHYLKLFFYSIKPLFKLS